MPLGIPNFVSNLLSSLKKAGQASEEEEEKMDSTEIPTATTTTTAPESDEPMEVEDLPLLSEVTESGSNDVLNPAPTEVAERKKVEEVKEEVKELKETPVEETTTTTKEEEEEKGVTKEQVAPAVVGEEEEEKKDEEETRKEQVTEVTEGKKEAQEEAVVGLAPVEEKAQEEDDTTSKKEPSITPEEETTDAQVPENQDEETQEDFPSDDPGASEVDPLALTEEDEPEGADEDALEDIAELTNPLHSTSPDVNSSELMEELGEGGEEDAAVLMQEDSVEFLVDDETAANVEVMEEEVSEDTPIPGEQDETTTGETTDVDVDEKENGEEGTLLGLEGFGDENDESCVEITRRRTSQEGNCYCGKERNLNIAELLCASCNRWYHESCIGYQLGKLVPFMTNYVFICKNCSPTGLESFKRNQAQFSQMCVTALANLTQASVKDGTNRKMFSKDKDIIPFFEMHWEGMTTGTRRVTQSWHTTVTKALQKEAGTLFIFDEALNDPDSPHFGLMSPDLTQIRPNYEVMIKLGHLKVTDLGMHQGSNSSALRGRGAKRRQIDSVAISQASIAKKSRADTYAPKLIGHGYPVDHPYNKDGYRYILAEPDPYAPFRQEFDESNDWAGRPIPGWLYRVLNPCSVLLALHDRAPQLRVSEDRLSVTGEKGYCMIRATHGVSRGSWYWEAKITDQPEGAHTRIGFSQAYGNLQGPLGYDRYGYSWRSRMGTKFHQAVGKTYCKGGYGHGDVIGFLIVMPEDTNPKAPLVPPSYKDRPLVRFKSHLYYEDKDEKAHEADNSVRPGSKILCFKNGEYQGVAYEDIFEGIYYPAISLYKTCTVNVNFGPDFWAEPEQDKFPHRGMFERAETAIVEQTVSDLHFLTEHHGKLRLENAVVLPQ